MTATATAAGARVPSTPRTAKREWQLSMSPFVASQMRRTNDLAAREPRADFDWNNQFHDAMDAIAKLNLNSHSETRLTAYQKLSNLAADFSYTVKTYARIIISEAYLPREKKTIRPVDGSGGSGDGEKFIVHRIVFKFALCGGSDASADEEAARVANHELKSLMQVLDCWEPGVHLPMMALVDYRGFRVVGMTLLPINASTLVFGSTDGGRTLRTNTVLEEKLARIAAKLNVKSHLVSGGVAFDTPANLEGHLGTDGLHYLVNFSRIFPPQFRPSFQNALPETPDPPTPLQHKTVQLQLQQHQQQTSTTTTTLECGENDLLRPEFVSGYEKALFPNATVAEHRVPKGYSEAMKTTAQENVQDLRDATDYLVKTVVPRFAERLVAVPAAMRENFRLVMRMHEAGINVRFLGLLHNEAKQRKDEYWCVQIMIEMCARVIKNQVRALLRRKMRELLLPGESVYRSAVVAHLNLVFGSSRASLRHWSTAIVPALSQRFPPFVYSGKHHLLHVITQSPQRLGLRDGRCLLFAEVARVLGLQFTSTTWQELRRNGRAFDRHQPFTDTDLREMKERLKEMNIALHATGFMLKVKAKMSGNDDERKRLLELAAHQFELALDASPNNRITLRNLGDCLAALDRFDEAQDCYLRALAAAATDTTTLYKYAIALDKRGRLDEAEEYFLRSLEACPTHSNCCYYYADFLCHHRKNFVDAERFYQRSLEIDPNNRAAANNFAVFLATDRRDYDCAQSFFKVAVSHSHNPVHYLNYASFLLYIRRDNLQASRYLDKARKLGGKVQ